MSVQTVYKIEYKMEIVWVYMLFLTFVGSIRIQFEKFYFLKSMSLKLYRHRCVLKGNDLTFGILYPQIML